MGPMYGDPYCICRMQQLGLPYSEKYKWTDEQLKELDDALSKFESDDE